LTIAAELDPTDPAIWNNLGNYYGHEGPTEKAFECYEKAIALNPREAVYYQNFGATVFLFRKAAIEYWNITEPEVFDKAMALYAKARELDPTDFPLATDVAQSYYVIRPPRTEDALRAWTNALHLARDTIESDGVHIHLARFKLTAGRFDEARAHLNIVTNGMYTELKAKIFRNIGLKEQEAKGTNAPPAP
jgi:tetratricopeptide (TPR) repeat protein